MKVVKVGDADPYKLEEAGMDPTGESSTPPPNTEG